MARVATSMAFETLSGTAGDLVVVRLKSGHVMRRKPTYKRPTSPGQQAAADRLKAATTVWNTFGEAEAEGWSRYADGLERTNPVTLVRYSPIAYNAFTALSTKLLQMDPSKPLPHYPPTASFMADSIEVRLTPGQGAIVFEASGPNSTNTVTELLTQKLVNIRRKPESQYKTAGFHHFEEGAMSRSVPIESGVYACAYRFVNSDTGQMTDWMPVGKVIVQ